MEHLLYLPRISRQAEHCKLIEWRREEGDHLTAGEPLLLYETQKASSVLEVPVTGTLKQIIIASGEWLDVADPVGIITIKQQ